MIKLVKSLLSSAILFYAGVSVLLGQIAVDVENYTPERLIEEVLFTKGCNQPTNIKFSGANTQKGRFVDATSSIGFGAGIILSTGKASNIGSPPTQSSSKSVNPTAEDNDLQVLIGGVRPTNDAVVLEFDLLVQDDSISFDYVFASEEYPNFVCSNFNDAFALFISGPGINGQKNMAALPNGTGLVSINNVNNGNPSEICKDPTLSPTPVNKQFYVSNNTQENSGAVNAPNFIFNGFTTVLTAKTAVQRCETYHFKIVIADVADGGLDSGILLREGSFSQKPSLKIDVLSPTSSDTVPEGCSGMINFTLDNITQKDTTIDLTFSGTATNGVDYVHIPGSVTIPKGSKSAQLPLDALDDGTVENLETIVVSFKDGCPCQGGIVNDYSINIIDRIPISIEANDTTVCESDTLILSPKVNGLGPFSYLWSNGETSHAIEVIPKGAQTYTLEVTDTCGISESKSITVTGLTNTIKISSEKKFEICANESLTFEVSAEGGTGSYTYKWDNGLPNGPTQTVQPTTSTSYPVEIRDECHIRKDTIDVSVRPIPVPTFVGDSRACAPYTSKIANTAGIDSCTCFWDLGNGQTSISCDTAIAYYATPDECFNVSLSITNNDGCTGTTRTQDFICMEPEAKANFTFFQENPNVLHSEVTFIQIPNPDVASSEWIVPNGLNESYDEEGDLFINFPKQPNIGYKICLSVITKEGCSDTSCQIIGIEDIETAFVPNAFTPDGDGINDLFQPIMRANVSDYKLRIFNRWGQLVYVSSDQNEGWDGKILSSEITAEPGLYVWQMYYVHYEIASKQKAQGHVSLVR